MHLLKKVQKLPKPSPNQIVLQGLGTKQTQQILWHGLFAFPPFPSVLYHASLSKCFKMKL